MFVDLLSEKSENPQRDSTISSTNQTSVEVSTDDILNQTAENFPISYKTLKNFKTKPLRPLSESKKLQQNSIRHYHYTDISRNRPTSVEKYKSNHSLEGKSSKRLQKKPENSYKTQFLESHKPKINHASLKIKQFTPVLSNKRVKLLKIDTTDSKSIISSVPDSEIVPLPQIQPKESLSKPDLPKQHPIVFSSPLKNLKNFKSVSETNENPYANFELSPNLTQILEDLQKNLSFSDEDEEIEENDVKTQIEKLKVKIREPSFGVGGGEFEYEDEKSVEETLYYEPRVSESEKNVQTEGFSDVKSILSMVTNQEFINSLKIIGKFASFIQNNLVVS